MISCESPPYILLGKDTSFIANGIEEGEEGVSPNLLCITRFHVATSTAAATGNEPKLLRRKLLLLPFDFIIAIFLPS